MTGLFFTYHMVLIQLKSSLFNSSVWNEGLISHKLIYIYIYIYGFTVKVTGKLKGNCPVFS